MTTAQLEKRVSLLKARYESLDESATELWNTAETEAEVDRYNDIAQKCNDALDEWLSAEAELFARWDEDALKPKGV